MGRRPKEQPSLPLETSVELLELTVHLSNCFQMAGIRTLGDIVTHTAAELVAMAKLRRKDLKEVQRVLDDARLALAPRSFRSPGKAGEHRPPKAIQGPYRGWGDTAWFSPGPIAVEAPLTQSLYRLSLEAPGRWFMTLGTALQTKRPYLDIGAMSSFVRGFQDAVAALGVATGWEPFFLWLRDEAGVFTERGWARECLDRAGGKHLEAIQVFFNCLHDYLLLRRPRWFVELNAVQQPSRVVDGDGTPVVADVRKREHVIATTGAEPVVGPDVRLRAVNLRDGHHVATGLPLGVLTWRSGSRSRIVYLDSDLPEGTQTRANARLLRSLDSPAVFLRSAAEVHERAGARQFEAVVVDAAHGAASLLTVGGAGAALVRSGRLVGVTSPLRHTEPTQWTVEPGDHVMLVSSAIAGHVRGLKSGPLPAALATCEPIAWAQCVRTDGRRLAVDVYWAPPATGAASA